MLPGHDIYKDLLAKRKCRKRNQSTRLKKCIHYFTHYYSETPGQHNLQALLWLTGLSLLSVTLLKHWPKLTWHGKCISPHLVHHAGQSGQDPGGEAWGHAAHWLTVHTVHVQEARIDECLCLACILLSPRKCCCLQLRWVFYPVPL